jgi:uncharacterized protein
MIDTPRDADAGPPSPCTKICSIDRRTGWCIGCFRSGEEIGAWPTLSPAAKRALLADLPPRAQHLRHTRIKESRS